MRGNWRIYVWLVPCCRIGCSSAILGFELTSFIFQRLSTSSTDFSYASELRELPPPNAHFGVIDVADYGRAPLFDYQKWQKFPNLDKALNLQDARSGEKLTLN